MEKISKKVLIAEIMATPTPTGGEFDVRDELRGKLAWGVDAVTCSKQRHERGDRSGGAYAEPVGGGSGGEDGESFG